MIMEKELNIAAILKDKPKGTKLWSPICGEVKLPYVGEGSYPIIVECGGGIRYCFTKEGKLNNNGECLLFPSKEMRDWEKLAWKKGDVLKNNDDTFLMFEAWNNEQYIRFKVKFNTYYNNGALQSGAKERFTGFWTLANNDERDKYIKAVEKHYGGKLNMETLEIEKPKQECKFQPFQKVLIRDSDEDVWNADFFSHYKEEQFSKYCTIGGCWKHCIPYEGNEHLLGTTDNWKGGNNEKED